MTRLRNFTLAMLCLAVLTACFWAFWPASTANAGGQFTPDVTRGWNERVVAAMESAAQSLSTPQPLVFNIKAYGAMVDGSADDTAAVNAAIQAAINNGGGVVYFPPGVTRCNGQIAIPITGGTGVNDPPLQKSLIFRGDGNWTCGRGGTATVEPSGGSILDLRYSGGGTGAPKVFTRGFGSLEITGLTFTDKTTGATGTSNPFFLATNTTVYIHNTTFWGNGWINTPKTGTACDQDAIVLGGTDVVSNPDWGLLVSSPFQGYGTVIENCFFNRIRRAVLGQSYCNGVVIAKNTVWMNSGSGLAGGACFELVGQGASSICTGNVIRDNLLEIVAYPYPIKLTAYCSGNRIDANNFFDYDHSNAVLLYPIYLGSTCLRNTVTPGMGDASQLPNYQLVYDADGSGLPSSGNNFIISAQGNPRSGGTTQPQFWTGDFRWNTGSGGNFWTLEAYGVSLKDHVGGQNNQHFGFMANVGAYWDTSYRDAGHTVPMGPSLGMANNYDSFTIGKEVQYNNMGADTGRRGDCIIGRAAAGQLKFGNAYAGSVYTLSLSGAAQAVTLDCSQAMAFIITLNGYNEGTVTITNPMAGQEITYTVIYDGSHTSAWPAGVKWVGGAAPATTSQTNLYRDTVKLFYTGSVWQEAGRWISCR